MPQAGVEVGTSVYTRVSEAVMVGVTVSAVSGATGVEDEMLF